MKSPEGEAELDTMVARMETMARQGGGWRGFGEGWNGEEKGMNGTDTTEKEKKTTYCNGQGMAKGVARELICAKMINRVFPPAVDPSIDQSDSLQFLPISLHSETVAVPRVGTTVGAEQVRSAQCAGLRGGATGGSSGGHPGPVHRQLPAGHHGCSGPLPRWMSYPKFGHLGLRHGHVVGSEESINFPWCQRLRMSWRDPRLAQNLSTPILINDELFLRCHFPYSYRNLRLLARFGVRMRSLSMPGMHFSTASLGSTSTPLCFPGAAKCSWRPDCT